MPITDITNPGWQWEHCYWVGNSTDGGYTIPDAGAAAVNVAVTAGVTPTFYPGALPAVFLPGNPGKYLVQRATPLDGPMTVVGIGETHHDTGFVVGPESPQDATMAHDLNDQLYISAGNKRITHPELRTDEQLWIGVWNGADSFLRINGVAVYGELDPFHLPARFAVNGRDTAHGNDKLRRFSLCAIYRGVLTEQQMLDIEAWAATVGLPVPRNPYTGTSDLQDLIDATPDGGVLDLAGQTFVTDRPAVLVGRRSLTVVGGTIIAPGDGSDIEPTEGMDPYEWPRARAHVIVGAGCRDITFDGVKIQGPNPTTRYERDLEEQSGFLIGDGADSVRVVDCDVSHVYGDGVAVGGASRNVDVLRTSVRVVGRQGISASWVTGMRIANCRIDRTGRSGIDIEPYVGPWWCADVDVFGNTVTNTTNLGVTLGGDGGFFNIRICNNTFDTHWHKLRGRTVRFTGNVCTGERVLTGQPVFTATAGVVVSGNTFRVSPDGLPFVNTAGMWSKNYTNGATPISLGPAALPLPLAPIAGEPLPPPAEVNDSPPVRATFSGTLTSADGSETWDVSGEWSPDEP